MSTIANLILAFVMTISTAVAGLVPGNNPSELTKQTGKAVSEIAKSTEATSSALLNSAPTATFSAKSDNFGSWVSSMTPDLPKEDGKTFGATVSAAAKAKNDPEETTDEDSNENGNKEPEKKPDVPPEPKPTKPPIIVLPPPNPCLPDIANAKSLALSKHTILPCLVD